jgi:anaerobic selenocysteine-containing dehydrogenase
MKKLERKDFLKIGGGAIAGGLSGYVFSGAPFQSLQWLVELTQDQYAPPGGKEVYLSAVYPGTRSECNLSVRMIGDRAVKIDTANSGGPFIQNALQLLYHPERIDAPLKRISGKGTVKPSAFEKVGWDAALNDIASRMNGLVSGGKGSLVAGISKEPGISAALLDRLIRSAGSRNGYYEPTLHTLSSAALGGYIDYDFMNSDFILSFGARLLEGWGDPCYMNNAFVEWKKRGGRLVHADAVRTRTGSMADQWLSIKPGTELFLALGIANYLYRAKGKTTGSADWAAVVNEYPADKVAQITGLTVKKIEDTAEAFSRARNPIAVPGRGGMEVSSSSAEIMAVHTLNTMVGTRVAGLRGIRGLGEPVLSAEVRGSLIKAKKFTGLDDFIKNGNFEMLFVNEADPVYRSAYGDALAGKMEKSFVVAIMPLLNDTALYADYIFPSIIFFEKDIGTVKAPFHPYMKSRNSADMIIELAKRVEVIKGNFPWSGYRELAGGTGGAAAGAGYLNYNAKILKDEIASITKRLKPSEEFPLSFVPVELTFVGDGEGMAYPYVLKTIDDKTFSRGKLWVRINRDTARRYGVSEGERIDIESPRGKLGSVRALLTDTVPPDTIAIPMGFGHKAYTKYAKNKGVNPKGIMANDIDPLTGTANWWLTRVKIS